MNYNFAHHAKKTLQQAGYKITSQRTHIITILQQTDKVLTPYDMQKHFPATKKIDTVTIYRILDLFVELGLAHKVHSCNGYVKCDIHDDDQCHHFLVCKACHRVNEIAASHDHEITINTPSFTPEKHIYEVIGTCAACQ